MRLPSLMNWRGMPRCWALRLRLYWRVSRSCGRASAQKLRPLGEGELTGCTNWSGTLRFVTLAEIHDKLAHISGVWRSEMASEQRIELADKDDCLAELDDMDTATAGDGENLDELRGRIEILMDEIEIMLGLEPPAIIPPEDYDLDG